MGYRTGFIHNLAAWLCAGVLWCAMALLQSCSSTKFVPDGSLLLDDVKVEVNDSSETLTNRELLTYVHQRPNNRFLNIAKLRLGVYNMSGRDSTRWWNKWVRRLGEPPVIYNAEATASDERQLLRAVNNAGFLDATVVTDSFPDYRRKRTRLRYSIEAGRPHTIRSIAYSFPNDTIREIVMRDSLLFPVGPGGRLDRNLLEQQRDLVTRRMQNSGYWAFGKEYVTFTADTAADSKLVDLTMFVRPPSKESGQRGLDITRHHRYLVRNVYCIPDYNGADCPDPREYQARDTVRYRNVTVLYGDKRYLRPSVLNENCFFTPGRPYSVNDLENTYSAFGRLSILKFINIRLMPAGSIGTDGLLDVYILLTPGKSQSISAEVEGTNSEGDFGVALALAYAHRNIGKGSETLNLRARGSYQALNGNLEGFIHNRFMEYGVDASVVFPKFKIPFLRESFKRRIKASTEFNMSINYQERPEYTRIVSAVGWNYKWSSRRHPSRYVWTPLDVSYVYLPASTNDFIDQIAPDNPLLRYSYEDHFIMRLGYTLYRTNRRIPTATVNAFAIQPYVSTLRISAETAGNLLYAISSLAGQHRSDGAYKLFGIQYAQYAKAELDYTYTRNFNDRNALSVHVGTGIAVPYGNSSMVPFEKRFYAGGANGVRGWGVRTLGPGAYDSRNSVSDFINQCGDIRLDLSLEYRAKLFWVFEGALFVDAGNIWTIRNYATQPGGVFRFNKFYKQIAAAYGVGLRMDFTYFLLRLDLGLKAHNPAEGQEPWPIIHPRWSRDANFHFSVGYPF